MQPIVRSLLKQFPWFSAQANLRYTDPYTMHAQFGACLYQGIASGALSVEEVDEAFTYLNTLGVKEADSVRAWDLLCLALVELLREVDEPCRLAKEKLHGEALRVLEEVQESQQIIGRLFDQFPCFADRADLKDQGRYCVLGQFASYLEGGVSSGTFDGQRVDRAFSFLNEMGLIAEHNRDVANLLAVGILEILTDTDESIRVTREKLQGRAASIFEEMVDFWKGSSAPTSSGSK